MPIKIESTIDVVKLNAISELRSKTQDLIYSRYSQVKQANMQARYVELMELQVDPGLTSDEILEKQIIKDAWTFIKEARFICNSCIDEINTKTTTTEIRNVVSNFKTEMDLL